MDENHLESTIDDEEIRDATINISDVIEVIRTDPDFKESTMFNGGGEVPQPAFSTPSATPAAARPSRRRAFVQIVEQPASKALRFRYECEGRSAGSIPGASSTSENKTFPSIRVVGYQGRAVVVVSCVTKDKPYRPHPHNLVGREGCKKGVCTLEISQDTMSVTFSNLGIQCVKKKDIENALRIREEIKVDPFMTGFGHRNQPTSIDLNAVRLCFQVFLEGEQKRKFTVPLTPVVSEPIYDKKAMSDLAIVKLSHCTSCVDGGTNEIILLCEKVAKEDIQVRFYEEKDGQVVWEGYGDFQPTQVHKQTAICFKPPRYRTLDITEPVKVFIQLKRPSDGACSEALPFEFRPMDSEPGMCKRKRQKFHEAAQRLRQADETERTSAHAYLLNIPTEGIKIEPRDKTPSPYGGQVYTTAGLSPVYVPNQAISPQFLQPTTAVGTPSPCDIVFNQQSYLLPPIDTMMPVNLNLPSNVDNAMVGALQQDWNLGTINDLSGGNTDGGNFSSASGISNILNLDNQQFIDTNNLSETFTHNLSLTDLEPDQNMTDSGGLTRLANSTLDRMCQFGDMYKDGHQ